MMTLFYHSFTTYCVLLSALAFTLGCQEDEHPDRLAESDQSSSSESEREQSQWREESAGESFSDEQPRPEDTLAAGDEANALSESAASQTWQESEAAQRQPIVDVGGGSSLTLHSQRVSTRVEGHRARTVVDQIFYSPYERTLEGTFRYSLPVGATVAHYALYIGRISGEFDELGDRAQREPLAQRTTREQLELSPEQIVDQIGEDAEAWGELRVGRVVSQADGREVYEDTTRRRVDPALVENVSPNAFQARVFPIQPRGYTRIVFAYEEDLARVDDELIYTFPLPADEIAHFAFQMEVIRDSTDDASRPAVESSLPLTALPARTLQTSNGQEGEGEEEEAEGGEGQESEESEESLTSLVWTGEINDQGPGGAVSLRIPAMSGVEVITGSDAERSAFTARLSLEGISALANEVRVSNDRAIFVLDTSLSSRPTRFAINRALLSEILTQNSEIREFAVLTFDLGAEWITEGFVENNESQRAATLAEVDRILLEGATRFDAVTQAISQADWISGKPDLFLLSDGAINWGTQAPDQISLGLNQIERVFTYRTGIGAENESLYRSLTRRGGVFSCLTMDSIPHCATAHTRPKLRLNGLEVVGAGERPAQVREVVYTHRGGDVFDGAELKVAGELISAGDAEVVLSLHDGSRSHLLRAPLTLREPRGQLAPRAWAELLVSVMSESGQSQLRDLIYALSQRYTVLTREVVLLVLETDEEYTAYHLDQVWSETLAEVESIMEALEQASATGVIFTPFIEQVLTGISPQIESATRLSLDELLGELDVQLTELSLPLVAYDHLAVRATQHAGEDLDHPSRYDYFLRKAELRQTNGDHQAAARVLSSIVENAGGDGVALRLVAYRLSTWGFTGLAAELFTEVLRRRPYEPQSYRDLAHVSREERPELAALLYEVATRGRWDERFQQMNLLIGEEYQLFIRELERAGHPLSERLRGRSAELNLPDPRGDLRVILSWNTDNVDIDLWVTDPHGEKCFYASPQNARGGELLDDVTQGFGPERFSQANADAGEYVVQAHYYGNNGNLLEAETFVHVTVIKYAGTDREEVIETDTLLRDVDAVVTMARVSFE